jgi:phosphocarrier protein HPr
MKSADVTISNRLGLHARPASKLVHLAASGKSDVFLVKEGQRVNARSILGVMLLAAEFGSTLRIEVNGEDESEMLLKLANLFAGKFGEE